MANRYPLVANASTLTIQELPSNDTLLVDNLTSTGNLSVAGNSNLGLVSTVFITGGTSGQYLTTDGNGNLSFSTISVSTDSISNGTSNVKVASSGGNVGISVGGTANVVNVTSSNVFVSANITPTANITYNLGTSSNRFKDLWLSNSTIYIGGATITTDGGNLVLTNPDGGQSVVSGNQTVSSNTLVDGNSNIVINTSGNINLSANGTANVLRVTGTGANITGTLNATGNANVAALGATGNVSAAYFIGNGSQLTGIDATAIQNGNSNVKTYANANVAISVAGNANVLLVTGTGANIAGTLNVTGNANAGNLGATAVVATTLGGTLTTAAQPNITSVGTLTSLTVTGTATAGNVYANSGTIGAANLTGTLTTAAQPNITSTGTLTSATVTGNVVAGNVYANTGTIGAQLVAGTLTTAAQPNVTSLGTLSSLAVTANITAGNVSGGNLVTANYFTGTLTTGAQPNITSLGTLTSATSSGNIQANGNLISDNVIARTGTLTLSASGSNQDVDIKPTGTGTVDVWGARISNVATPTQASDAATKDYVDTVVQGLHVHDSCYVGTTGTLATASGGTVTYNNGTSGVGATLTTTGTYLLIDGANVQTVGTRIMVKNESNGAWNGIYTYTSTTVLTRATDFDTTAEAAGGDFFFITSGSTQADTGWVQTTDNPTIGTSNIVFTQFSGQGTYSAGTGLTLTGTTFSITNTAVTAASYGNGDRVASFTVNSQGQLTAASNVVIAANAANLTGTTLASSIITSSLTTIGTLGTLSVTGNANVGNIGAAAGVFTTVAGSLTTASQPNITSVGTLSTLSVTGNANVGNIGGTAGVFTTVAGSLTTASQPNITSLGSLSSLTVTGNGTFGNILGPHANGNSNVNIPAAAGNVNISVNGTANVLVVTATGANVTGTFNASGNANVGNIGTAQVLATANVTAPTLISNVATGTAPLTVTSTTLVANLYASRANVSDYDAVTLVSTGTYYPQFVSATSGNLASSANAVYVANIANGSFAATTFVGALSGAATTAGTVTTAAQPNITSTGTLTGLTVSAATANIRLQESGAGSKRLDLSVDTNGVAKIAADQSSQVIVISTVGANRMLFDANGNVGIANGAPTHTLSVTGTTNVSGNITAGNLTCSTGTVTAATLTETSSIAIKENFRPIENPLDTVLKLVGHIYDRKDGSTKGEAGLVAEQVAEILPNLVGLDSEGNPDSVKYSRLTVYLLESIKVLKDEIDSLKGNKRKSKK